MSKANKARPLIRALLIDVSGNLHVGSHATSNAVEAYHRLRASNIPFRLCSNTSKESTVSLVRRLNKLGFGIETPPVSPVSECVGSFALDTEHLQCGSRRQEVWTSIGAVTQYIRKHGLERPFFLLSSSAKEEIASTLGWSDQLDSGGSPYDSVIVGLAPDLFDYSHLNTAFRILKGEHGKNTNLTPSDHPHRNVPADRGTMLSSPQLIATHKAKYIQTETPFGLSLGPGPFVTALETAANVEAHVVGKPTKLFFQTVIDNFFEAGELNGVGGNTGIVVIGDDVEADLGDGAIEMGLWRVLVKTGKYRPGDENRPAAVPPDEVFDSFAAFIEELLTEQVL